jgi:CBS domain-containing protein
MAADVMSRRVVTLRTNMRVIDAMRSLIRHRISGAPVLDRQGNLVGLVSEFDCLRVVASGLYGHEELEDSEPLRRVMSSEVLTISPDTDVFAITQLLVDKRIRRVPVVVEGKVLGIVSRRDVLRGIHKLRRRQMRMQRRHADKGLYLSATDDSGEVANPFLR